MTTPPASAGQRPLLAADGLVRHFRSHRGRRVVRAVDGVSFEIRAGETFGLVGESGSGKSTIARLLLRLERPDAGSVIFDGLPLESASRTESRRLHREIQIVFQDPVAALNRRKTVGDIIAAPLIVHRVGSSRERAERVRELLELVGLSENLLERYPSSLSGGQCQRVGIARALALEPRLIVLDEAVSAVDVSTRAQILNLLQALQERLGLSYLFISHDLSVVRYMAGRLAVMYRGKIVETGERDEVFQAPEHPYTRALLEAVPDPEPSDADERAVFLPMLDVDEEADVHRGCAYRDLCPVAPASGPCDDEVPELRPRLSAHPVACHFPRTERL